MKINLLIKGILVGIAKIVPGFSGAILMISFGLYDKTIEAITNFFVHPKKNFSFLFSLCIGIMIGIVLFSRVISYFLISFPLFSSAFLIGLIAGGLPLLKKEISFSRDFFFVIGAMVMIVFLSFLVGDSVYVVKNTYHDMLIFVFSGFLEAVGTVVPGVSSTSLLMLVGIYHYFVKVLGNLFIPSLLCKNLFFLIPFSVGFVLGVILLSLFIRYLFLHYRKKTFAIIFGISLATIVILVVQMIQDISNIFSLIGCVFLFIIGFFTTMKLN